MSGKKELTLDDIMNESSSDEDDSSDNASAEDSGVASDEPEEEIKVDEVEISDSSEPDDQHDKEEDQQEDMPVEDQLADEPVGEDPQPEQKEEDETQEAHQEEVVSSQSVEQDDPEEEPEEQPSEQQPEEHKEGADGKDESEEPLSVDVDATEPDVQQEQEEEPEDAHVPEHEDADNNQVDQQVEETDEQLDPVGKEPAEEKIEEHQEDTQNSTGEQDQVEQPDAPAEAKEDVKEEAQAAPEVDVLAEEAQKSADEQKEPEIDVKQHEEAVTEEQEPNAEASEQPEVDQEDEESEEIDAEEKALQDILDEDSSSEHKSDASSSAHSEQQDDFNVIEETKQPENPYPQANNVDKTNEKGYISKIGSMVGSSINTIKSKTEDVLFTKSQPDNQVDKEVVEDIKNLREQTLGKKEGGSRASALYRSFTDLKNKVPGLLSPQQKDQKQVSPLNESPKYVPEEDSEEKSDESINEEDLLENIMDEDSDEDSDNDRSSGDDDSSDESGDGLKKKGSDSSIVSDQDLLNRSLSSDCEEAVDGFNFLRYTSDKITQSQDLLEIIDRNERSFKQVAEKMIAQSSQLEAKVEDVPEGMKDAPQRRLMHMKLFKKIADSFHADIGISKGVPYSIAAVEDFIAIGSSTGAVRLYDLYEQEIKSLTNKSIKANAVTCLDIKRLKDSQNIFIVSGHLKGHISLYEIKGLHSQDQMRKKNQQKDHQNFVKEMTENLFGNVEFKHRKTIDDAHKTTVVQVKFVGNYRKDCQIISCDLRGIVYLTTFDDGLILFTANKKCLMERRLGASYSLAPLQLTKPVVDYEFFVRGMHDEKEIEREKKRLLAVYHQQICAFGTLDEIYVAVVRPTAIPMLSCRRPPYVSPGTVPYLDWGHALTPSFRDQAYPVLAMAWGRTIQLAVYTNQREVLSGASPELQLDGFYISDAFSIDQCFFLSESLLMIIVGQQREIRILYTQNFTPGTFDPNYASRNLRNRKIGGDSKSEEEQATMKHFTTIKSQYAGEVSGYAEKDKGYRLLEEEIRHKDNSSMMEPGMQSSKFNFNPTVCKNFDYNVIALGKTTIGQKNLIHWEEYLDLIRRTNPDDWLKVLRASLDIFSGKMVGLGGLPDSRDKREVLLRTKMKNLLRENIDACIREFQESESASKKTLRVATEFCIRVGAIDHLFGEFFVMFAEAGMEQRYFENLDAFILSGKFKTFKIPEKILQRLIEFYRAKDVELLEKAILNINFTKYSNVEAVRHICEEEYLSSALIHLLTTLFDDDKGNDTAVCLGILCQLFNMMVRSKVQVEKQEILALMNISENSGTSLFEQNSLEVNKGKLSPEEQEKWDEYTAARKRKLEIEHSSTYIGYKLLWVITIFLEGRKFPTGTLSSFKWRCYVYDIVRFCTNDKFMRWFLEFDPESFFQVVKKLFIDKEPFDFIRSQGNFIMMHKEDCPQLEMCLSHELIVEQIDLTCQDMLKQDVEANDGHQSAKGEALQNAFLFFMMQISRKRQVQLPEELCLRIISQCILFHKKVWKLPREQLDALIPQTQLAKKVKDRNTNIYAYLIKKNEQLVLQLLQRFSDTMTEAKIEELLNEANRSPMFKLRVFLYQLMGDFQKCLELFFQKKAIKQDVFIWLDEVQTALDDPNANPRPQGLGESDEEDNNNFFDLRNVPSRISYDKMKNLIIKNIGQFVAMDPNLTVKVCDQWFESDYLLIAEELKNEKDLAFNFLETVLGQNEAKILYEFNHSVMASRSLGEQSMWTRMMLKFVEVLCEKKYRSRIVEYVSQSYYPIDDSLAICEEKGALEACAVLYKRKGFYLKSIELYNKVMVNLCSDKIIHSLFVERNIGFRHPECTNKHIKAFDELILDLFKICDKYGSRLTEIEMEKHWLESIKGLYSIPTNVESMLEDLEDEERQHFDKFIAIRQQFFMNKLSEHVNLRKVIGFLEKEGHKMKYQEFKQTFEDKIRTDNYFESILNGAEILVLKDILADWVSIQEMHSQGCVNLTAKCDSCKLPLSSKWDQQDVWFFGCDHSFHARCLSKTDGQCAVCFNDMDIIVTLSQLKKKKSRRGSTHSNQSSDDQFEKLRKKKGTDLKESALQATSRNMHRRTETKAERQNRLMQEINLVAKRKNLDLASFNT